MEVPGRAGYGILGDESIEFYRTPMKYVEKRQAQYGPIFLGRLLTKPTIFVTANSAVSELLNEKWQNFCMGYKEYMFQLFDDNLVFLEGDAWESARAGLQQVFSCSNLQESLEICKQIISSFLRDIPQGEPVDAYQTFKALSTRLSIGLFLGDDLTNEEAQEISELMSEHWRGIISLPVNMKAPWAMWKSGFSKAIAAKDRLLKIIGEKLDSKPSVIAAGVNEKTTDKETTCRHLLLFVSALLPKAMGSLMTSTILELSRPENERWREECRGDDSVLEDVILEVQRLHPPFLGGRRVCTKECEIAGYRIQQGQSVTYLSRYANRDDAIFCRPDQFNPERWKDENKSHRDLVWTFGGGPRMCLGKRLSETLIKEWLRELLSTLRWELPLDQDLSYKMLPVSRPTSGLSVTFTRLDH